MRERAAEIARNGKRAMVLTASSGSVFLLGVIFVQHDISGAKHSGAVT